VQYWLNSSFASGMSFVLSEVVSQWTNPQLVVAGLSSGLLGWGAVSSGFKDGANVVARHGTQVGTNLTKSQLKSVQSFEKQVLIHTEKLKTYKADPWKFDNMGHLKNAPNDAVRQRIIQSRINHLENEIQTFQNSINLILYGK
jgi:hypothetical protein